MLNSGMKIERTGAGLEARLAIAGIGRFFSASFLAVWLAGWAAGEAFALWMLAVGAWSLLTGQPPGAGREPLRPEMALPVGLFLLFWLALWTLGGVMAGRELLRLLLAATASASAMTPSRSSTVTGCSVRVKNCRVMSFAASTAGPAARRCALKPRAARPS